MIWLLASVFSFLPAIAAMKVVEAFMPYGDIHAEMRSSEIQIKAAVVTYVISFVLVGVFT